jgi:hypothetical protein
MGLLTLVSLGIAVLLGPGGIVGGLVIGIAGSAVIVMAEAVPTEFYHRSIVRQMIMHPNQSVRVSISYLFRIRSSGRYLLMQGARYPGQYQPIGGVYKFFPSAAPGLRSKFALLDDDLLPVDQTSDGDLRIRIPGKHLIKFLNWFDSGFGRECTPAREFHEELIASGFLNASDFPFLKPQYCGRHLEPIRYSDYAKSSELLVADIYELILTDAQLSAIEAAVTAHSDKLIWATSDQIERRGAVPGSAHVVTVSEHSSWLLN